MKPRYIIVGDHDHARERDKNAFHPNGIDATTALSLAVGGQLRSMFSLTVCAAIDQRVISG